MRDSIAEVYMDYYQQSGGTWSKVSSTMVDSWPISSSHGGGSVSYALNSTAPVQAVQVIDIDEHAYSDSGHLKHPLLQDNVESFSTFKYAQCSEVDVTSIGSSTIGTAALGRIATKTTDKLEVVVPELAWNKVKLHSFYEDNGHLTSTVSTVNGICSIAYPDDIVDNAKPAVVMSYDGQLGLLDESTGAAKFVNKHDLAAAVLSNGSIDYVIADSKCHIIGSKDNSTYDFSFS